MSGDEGKSETTVVIPAENMDTIRKGSRALKKGETTVTLSTYNPDGTERQSVTFGEKQFQEATRKMTEGTPHIDKETGEITEVELNEADAKLLAEAAECLRERRACALNIGEGGLWRGLQAALAAAAEDLEEDLPPGYEEASPPTIKLTLKLEEDEDGDRQIHYEVRFDKRKPTSRIEAGEAQMVLTDGGIALPRPPQTALRLEDGEA